MSTTSLPKTQTQHQSTSSRPSSSTAYNHPSTSTANSSYAALHSSSNKSRQYAHLHAQLAQLNAHLADTENLVKVTSVQARDMRFLGGYVGGLFMGSARVLGEESVAGRGGDGQSGEGS